MVAPISRFSTPASWNRLPSPLNLSLDSSEHRRQTRLNLARDLVLLRQYESVADVAYAAGFYSMSHFAKLCRAGFRENPGETFKSISHVNRAS